MGQGGLNPKWTRPAPVLDMTEAVNRPGLIAVRTHNWGK